MTSVSDVGFDRPLFLFYEEPDPDRFFRYDRYARRIIRRIVRGPMRPGSVMRWFLNLEEGLRELGVELRINDYRGLSRAADAWACVVGKPHVLDKIPRQKPVIFGPGVSGHPYDCDPSARENVKAVVVSCDWMKQMYERDMDRSVPCHVWYAGIQTDLWKPQPSQPKQRRVLVYDKIRWRREEYVESLLNPVRKRLQEENCQVEYLRYGAYREEEYHALISQMDAMVFLCEHETQGFAYLQALSSGVPIIAWDRGGLWQDPSMYPHRVQFGPVTSVPYFESRCGVRFTDNEDFQRQWNDFFERVQQGEFRPREYVLDHFQLKDCAKRYLELITSIQRQEA